ncbi:hypothetical protein [Streptomyces mirabilis]|uniref:hypothetical protein n=1 Tax=Streptomyces mirabilis TaxID=68239 RepID=UPI0033BCB578
MASRVEWQWRDRPSGPAYRQRVVVHDDAETADAGAQAAFLRLVNHCLACPTCRTVDEDGWANASCVTAEEPYQAWRRLWHALTLTGTPSSVGEERAS